MSQGNVRTASSPAASPQAKAAARPPSGPGMAASSWITRKPFGGA